MNEYHQIIPEKEQTLSNVFGLLRSRIGWQKNNSAITRLAMVNAAHPSVSAYPFVDPNLTTPDPRPPANGIVFDTGYMPHSRFVTSAPPLCPKLITTGCGCGCSG